MIHIPGSHLIRQAQKQGSALLLTLLVVSLLLVVVLSFVVFVRLELRELVNRQQLFQARANARLGANLAVAQLQMLAGPDTRVTAPASNPSTPNNRLVGQVIDASAYRNDGSGGLVLRLDSDPQTADFTETVGYFISGDTFDPETYNPYNPDGTPVQGHALLVGPGSVADQQDYVAAPLVSLSGTAGSYAWWVSDEGLKAQINIVDNIDALVADGTLTSSQAEMARKATTQRAGAEAVLEQYEYGNLTHEEILRRSINLEQLNLTPGFELSPNLATSRFHDVTMRSEGLLTNTRRGGLMRDLMAVVKETEQNTIGLPSGPQWNQLMDYQQTRIERWGGETVALETFAGKSHHLIEEADRPGSIPERHWNGLQALTLRTAGTDPQNDPDLADRIFPPISDMHTRFDPGGAGWEQLMTWPTLLDRRGSGGEVTAQNRWLGETTELSPVIARVNISAYATLKYPEATLHFVPVVVLWNPYNVPLRMKPNSSDAWRVVVNYERKFQDRYTHNYWFRVRASNPQWTINSGNKFNHIPGRNQLWTPRFLFIWQSLNEDQHIFDLRDANGGTDVVIGPGQARIFTMHESHVDITPRSESDWSTTDIDVDTVVVLREGVPRQGGSELPSGGHFSVYRTVNLEDQMDDPPGGRPPVDEEIDQTLFLLRVGYEPQGGVNHWQPLGGSYSAKPYPFPLDPTNMKKYNGGLVDPTDNRYLYNSGLVSPPQPIPTDKTICVNNNYLRSGWDFHQLALEFGRDGQGGNETLKDLRVRLQEGTITNLNTEYSKILQEITLPYNRLPQTMSSNGGSASDYDTSEGASIPVFAVYETPSDSTPIEVDAPGFPAWGISYALRMPENSFRIDYMDGDNVGGSGVGDEAEFVLAQTRWLQDFNPSTPFAIRDPSSKSRYGFDNPASYVGGYFIGSTRYGELDWATPDGLNQFIGHTDDTLGGTTAILYEIPKSSDDIVSVASLAQAPLLPTKHALSAPPSSIPNRKLSTSDRQAIPYEMAQAEVNYHFMQPVNMIGNSRAHLMVDRRKAVQSFFPNDFFATARDTVPYGATKNPNSWSDNGGNWTAEYATRESYMPGYDTSWVYNEVLWDDFFFSSDLNTRYVWRNGLTPADRDFNTSAENILLSGAFNINSTSVAAWAAVLHTMMGLEQDVGGDPMAPFMRFLDSPTGPFIEADHTIEDEQAFSGYRRLSEAQLWDLATEISREVSERGPFLSLSDFVNRALVDSATDAEDHGIAGALQSAIDASGINQPVGEASSPDLWVDGQDEYVVPLPGKTNIDNVFSALKPENVSGPLNTGVAADLTQSDLLARIGVVLRPRSDTFMLRVLGLTGDQNSPTAKAWCEIVVQRTPEFVDNLGNAPGDVPTLLNGTNAMFGRRFEIVSFRWLTEEEI